MDAQNLEGGAEFRAKGLATRFDVQRIHIIALDSTTKKHKNGCSVYPVPSMIRRAHKAFCLTGQFRDATSANQP